MSGGGVVSRRTALATAGAFLVTAACAPETLFGPRKPKPLSMGVSVFTGWADPRPEYGLVPGVQCPNLHPWAVMLAPDRVPAIGQYNEAEPSVTAWRLQQMERGGIEWCTYQHEWSPHLGRLLMNHCAENHPDGASVQFALSWWDVLSNSPDGVLYYANQYGIDGNAEPWTADRIRDSLSAYGQGCQPFTRKASYLRVGDRPVMFRGAAHSLAFYGQWGISPTEVLDLISGAFPERPYWVATATDPSVYGELKAWGFDAFTEYNLRSDSWAHAMTLYTQAWGAGVTIAKAAGIHYWVPALSGFDNRAFDDPSGVEVFEPPTPADFTRHLIDARTFADRHRDLTDGRVLVYAWSEFYEGGAIEPMAPAALHDGDEMLVAFRKAA